MYDYSFQDEFKKRETLRKKAYALFGLEERASKQDIRKKFLEMAKKHHPDKGGDEESFKEILLAYKILTDKNIDINNIELSTNKKENDEKYKTKNEWGYVAWWIEKFL
jgi:preprotein translocase subunit Sec63